MKYKGENMSNKDNLGKEFVKTLKESANNFKN